MAWQYEIVSVTTHGANIVPVVRFTNGEESYMKDYRANDITQDEVNRRATAEIALLEARDRALATYD